MSDETTKVGEALTIERRPDGVAVVRMDVPGEPVNTLKDSFSADFEQAFDHLAADAELRGVVFTSGKPDSFLAGADIDMLAACETAEQAADLSRQGQRALNRLADFKVPVVAAIHGACLGGGLEVALACDERVISDHPKTKLGLPEVQLGLLPGAGGTQRLPALVGVQIALDLLLTGKQLNARKAKKVGLADEVVPPAIVVEAAAERALKLSGKPRQEGFGARLQGLVSREALMELGLSGNPLGRKMVFDKARQEVLKKTHGNYPAAERILDVVKVGLESGLDEGLEAEAQAFGELAVTSVCRALMSIFFATQELKKDSGVDDDAVEAREVTKVGMLGAGLMGAGISYVTANKAGLPVRLKDKDAEGVGRGLKHVRGLLDGRVKRKRMSELERDRVMARVSGTTDYTGFAGCQVVIEAVFEDLSLKHRVLTDTEAACGPEAIFASNTSSLPITKIAEASAHPETVIGMHYFSPVDKMPLLEIITTEHTAPWVTATCVELGKQQGKTVIVVRDGVGFYTSRILGPYMNEAAHLLAKGVSVEAMDKALVKFGYPVGPITLLDEVGIDVAEKVGKIVHDAFGDRLNPPAGIERLIADGRLGRKNKKGFYVYDGHKGAAKKVDESVYEVLGVSPHLDMPAEHIADRLALRMVDEAVRCFEEGILRSARDGDIGAIFGLGFPPFRGGPFRYVDELGAAEVVRRLQALAAEEDPRFAPCALLERMAAEGLTFHGPNAVEPVQPANTAS